MRAGMIWWDSSALVAILLEQWPSDDLKDLLSLGNSQAVWWGTVVEAASAIHRSQRRRPLPRAAAAQLLTKVDEFLARALEVPPSDELRAIACGVLRVHDLRAADALQLAAALMWAEQRPAGRGFVCLDRKLREAAMREGFDVLPREESAAGA